MSIVYGIIAVISLCMVGTCVIMDKKRDIWLLLVFVSVSLCNLGYFMISISKVLDDALNSNRISYLGSVFLPFFLLMMVLRFCNIKRNNKLTVALAALGIVMLAITTSPGILPIYYSTVDIEFVNGTTKLVRTYGPLHMLYYVYLIGYMLSMICVALYAVAKRKIKSRSHAVLLLCAVFCNIIIWLIEQLLPRGFEWLSLSYIITECLFLAIYRSMQKQGLMDLEEKTQSYTVNILLSMFLLLFANFVRIATKETTELMYVTAQVVVIAIYIGILVFWSSSVYDRIVNKTIRRYLITLASLMIIWMLMRTLRHTGFRYIFPFGQWCWYAYYIAMILIPQVSMMASKYISKPEDYRPDQKWYLMYIPSLVLLIGILTNDLHQWAFRFHLGYEAGWDSYKRGFLYYAAVIWIFTCIAIMIIQIVKNCRIPGAKKMIWLPVAMLCVGSLYTILYTVDSDLFGFIEVTAALCFTVVAIWESCIKTGLLPSNSHYEELLKCSELGVSVVDREFDVRYRSDDAVTLTKDEMKKAAYDPIMLENGIRVSGSVIKGGYTIYQEDISELLEILDELKELREELKDANTVTMHNYQINKRIRTLAEKNRLHDELHKQTSLQINLLNDWLIKLSQTENADEKRDLLRRIVVVGTYLKRRNNLVLISEQDGSVKNKELQLSIDEMITNLRIAGVNCAASVMCDTNIPSDVAMQLFDFYEYVVEYAFDGLSSLLVRFFNRETSFYCCVDAVCSLDLTHIATDTVSVSITDDGFYTLSFKTEWRAAK
ncbi:MAG: hypothetical protein IKT65_05350 [Clostridia bacterium]|nr:hypothetical protein [Clostridia bacterium]